MPVALSAKSIADCLSDSNTHAKTGIEIIVTYATIIKVTILISEQILSKEDNPFRLGFLIHDVSRLRRTVVDKALRPLGVTRSQWWVLSNLSRRDGEGTMQTELAKLMDVGKVTLGGLIDRLELAGLVKRQPDPQDRRAKRLVMTPKGTKLLSDIQSIEKSVNAQIMQGIAKNDILRTEFALSKMKQQLIAMDAVPGGSGLDNEDENE